MWQHIIWQVAVLANHFWEVSSAEKYFKKPKLNSRILLSFLKFYFAMIIIDVDWRIVALNCH